MGEKKQPPSASARRTLYWTDKTEQQITLIAEKLHKQGIKGVYNDKGEVNRAAVIRYLLDKELGQG